MIKHVEIVNGSTPALSLHPPEVLESRLTPMFMCCGYWSYSVSVSLAGPTLTVTWTDDPNAACND
jgi:hypothetical protein